MVKYKLSWLLALGLQIAVAKCQSVGVERQASNKVAVPFLLLNTDAVSSGMGGAGAALTMRSSSPDLNPAKVSFLDQRFIVNLTYTPWLRKLVADRKLLYFGGAYKLTDKIALTASLNYLTYGQVEFIDNYQNDLGSIKPSEYIGSLGVSKKFGVNLSIAMRVKLIQSNLYGSGSSTVMIQSGTAYCADVFAIQRIPLERWTKPAQIGLSLELSNIGPKISYFNSPDQKSYLPANLKIGTSLKWLADDQTEIGIALDANKLLVPRNPASLDQGIAESILSSFNPLFGDLGASIGAECDYKKTVSFRVGYNLQENERSLGSFFSVGMGLNHKNIALNVAYLMGNQQKSFLSNTMRLSLGYSIN